MHKIITAIVLAAALAGCGPGRVKPDPVDESCDATCRIPCDTRVPVWAPADPEAADAWDTYPEQVTIPLRGQLRACELHRTACVQCLDRLKAAGVTR